MSSQIEDQSNRIKYNMEYLSLSERQCEIHDVIMLSRMNMWPGSLTDFIKRESAKYGICGELIVSCVEDWIAGREDSA